ncbi:excalibur calcium-binding domain-containing protein [Alteromonas macleodii]|uniref:excalibur calcium-binding domain-containing protein n=1 Tax=Alteromonas macleodii TaxID=28108 RepID=UPI00002FB443
MLNKLLLILIIAFGLKLYFQNSSHQYSDNLPDLSQIATQELPVQKPFTQPERVTFRCDGRQHCSQMGSYEEAKYFLKNCPDTKMDGDKDGIPCERQFQRFD